MKTELVINFAANGEMILALQARAYAAPAEIGSMCFSKAAESGNIIMGRTTYEMFAPLMKDLFAGLDVVVLTSKVMNDSVYTAKIAEDAVKYLEGKGYEKACVAGGAMTYNAFLEAGLADELYFNFFPVVINGGACLETAQSKVLAGYKLDYAKANGDVAMLHFIR